LTAERVRALAVDGEENLWLELRDLSGIDGVQVRLSDAGALDILRETRGAEHALTRTAARVPAATAVEVFARCARLDPFSIARTRKTCGLDEGRPELTLTARVAGTSYARTNWFFEGEAEKTPPFQALRERLRELAATSVGE
jgi:hypothetical protein